MRFVSTFLLFFGYLLVYAATAASGKFALEPWLGLFADAYTESTDPKAKTKPGPAPQAGFTADPRAAATGSPTVGRPFRPGTHTPSPAVSNPATVRSGGTPTYHRSVQPPARIVAAIRFSVATGNRFLATLAWRNMMAWGATSGVASLQLANWAAEQPWYPKLASMIPPMLLQQ